MDETTGLDPIDEQLLEELHFTTTPGQIARATGLSLAMIEDRLTVLVAEGLARYDEQRPGYVVATKAGLLRLHGR